MIQSYLNNLEKSINKYKHLDVNLSTSQRLHSKLINKKSRQKLSHNSNYESDSNIKVLPVIRRDNSALMNSSNTMLINNNSIYFEDFERLKKKKAIKTSFVLKASHDENSSNTGNNTKNPENIKFKFNKDENKKPTSYKFSMLNYQPPVQRYDYSTSKIINIYNLKSLDQKNKSIKKPNFDDFDAFKKYENLHYISKESQNSKIINDQISHRLNLKNYGINVMKNPKFYVNKAYNRVSNLINKQ